LFLLFGVHLMDEVKKCEYCHGSLVQINGELVCTSCGVVNQSVLINDNSRQQFIWKKETAPGNRVHIVDGLGSYIDYHNSSYFQDVKGGKLAAKKQYKFRKLKRRYNLRIKINNHETDYRSLMCLNRICKILDVSDNVRKRAAYLYKLVTKEERRKRIEKISNHIVLTALCLMVAIRESADKSPLRLKEVMAVFNKTGHRVSGKAILKLAQELPPELGITLKSRRSEHYLQRIISKITHHVKIKKRLAKSSVGPTVYRRELLELSQELLSEINLRMRGGRNPYIFAVSVVYTSDRILSKNKEHRKILTQKLLADICDVAEYSIRDHHRKVLKKKYLEKTKVKANQEKESFYSSNHRSPMFF
jgi:transcription initiation factor TFIIIB Brf1 subunit/transcription initiation factor TFIIB